MGAQLLSLGVVWFDRVKLALRMVLVLAVAATVLALVTAGMTTLTVAADWPHSEIVVMAVVSFAWLIIIAHTALQVMRSRNGLETLIGHIRRRYRRRFVWRSSPGSRDHLRFRYNCPPTNRRRSRLARVHRRHYPAH